MKITLEKISRYNKPCAAGVEWLARQKNCDLSVLIGTVIKNKPFKYGDSTWYPLDFALWALPQLMDKQKAVRYAVYAARQVLKSDDIISVKSLAAAEAWLKNPCEKTRLAAGAAEAWLKNPCDETRLAAGAAGAAAWMARAAAAAGAAEWAAWTAAAATEVASVAAWAAGTAAGAAETAAEAKQKMQVKILHYGVKLLGEENNNGKEKYEKNKD